VKYFNKSQYHFYHLINYKTISDSCLTTIKPKLTEQMGGSKIILCRK